MARPMPREAPVTRAHFPSKSILANLLPCVKRFLQALYIFNVHVFERAVNALVKAAERFARACLNEVCCSECRHGSNAVFPFYRMVCLLYKVFFNLVFFICLGLVCFLYYQMLVLETVNGDIFLDYGLSKNYPGSMLVIFNSLWAVWKYLHYKRMPLLLPILSTIMAFFLDGRSSLICMILITVLCFVDRGSKLTISLMILIFTFLLINYWGVITGFYELTSISSRGLETVRSDIWKAYFDYLDFSTLLFGLDTQNLPVLKEFGGNPHNSFFSFHRRMGLVGLCMLFYVLMKGFRALIKRRLYVVLYFNIVLLVRMFYDGMLMTAQDFFIFTLFFLPLSYNNKVFQIEDQLEKKGVNRLERLWDKFVFII
jgi:hypothetical protein